MEQVFRVAGVQDRGLISGDRKSNLAPGRVGDRDFTV